MKRTRLSNRLAAVEARFSESRMSARSSSDLLHVVVDSQEPGAWQRVIDRARIERVNALYVYPTSLSEKLSVTPRTCPEGWVQREVFAGAEHTLLVILGLNNTLIVLPRMGADPDEAWRLMCDVRGKEDEEPPEP